MKKIFLSLIFILTTSFSAFAAKVNKAVDIQFGGITRSYWLYVPDNFKRGAPMVMALHGASGSMTNNSPRFNEIADKEGFVIVYPQGVNIYFPVFGGSVTGWDASGEENDDVAFLKAVIDDVDSKYKLNRKRLYCCGFSNGGMMTYAMANTCGDVFAAFAAISGFPLNEFHLRHTGKRPVPFLHIHGKNDDFVKYSLMPVIVEEMVARNGANPVPTKTSVTGKYDKSVYEAGEGGFPYIYYEIDGMGHNDFTPNTEVGSSSQTMWNFFKQYTLDSPCDTTLKWKPRIETEGYNIRQHGWITNSGATILSFGRDQNTSGKQNVYRSLQFTTGSYKLCFKSSGDEGKMITVKINKLTGKKNTILNDSVPVGKDAKMLFNVEDGWGEYRIVFSRASTMDNISITDIAVYSASEEETSGIDIPDFSNFSVSLASSSTIYSLSGEKLAHLHAGINIIRYIDGSCKKVFIKE